jgi:hypothetical protein
MDGCRCLAGFSWTRLRKFGPFEQPRDTRQQVQAHLHKFELWHKNSTTGESRLEL